MAARKKKNLVIVESPAKAKTIEGFLGRDRVTVKASYGHIRDLPKQDAIDIENGFIGVNNSTPNTHVDVNGVIKCYKLWIGTTPFIGSNFDYENLVLDIVPRNDNVVSLGTSTNRWNNAYMRDLSVSSINVGINLNPLTGDPSIL